MLYEAKIIVPKHDNAGRDLSNLAHQVETELCSKFGGCTARDANGMWLHDGKLFDEPVTEIDVRLRRWPRYRSDSRRRGS